MTDPAISRRDWMKLGLMGAAGYAVGSNGLAAPVVRQPAKAVIQIWMWGGPAHLDTFDPKPDAGRDYCGAFTRPLATNADGIRIGEMLPQQEGLLGGRPTRKQATDLPPAAASSTGEA